MLRPHLDERQRRLLLGAEAEARELGRGDQGCRGGDRECVRTRSPAGPARWGASRNRSVECGRGTKEAGRDRPAAGSGTEDEHLAAGDPYGIYDVGVNSRVGQRRRRPRHLRVRCGDAAPMVGCHRQDPPSRDLISATTTATELTMHAEPDTGAYPTGTRHTKKQVEVLPVTHPAGPKTPQGVRAANSRRAPAPHQPAAASGRADRPCRARRLPHTASQDRPASSWRPRQPAAPAAPGGSPSRAAWRYSWGEVSQQGCHLPPAPGRPAGRPAAGGHRRDRRR